MNTSEDEEEGTCFGVGASDSDASNGNRRLDIVGLEIKIGSPDDRGAVIHVWPVGALPNRKPDRVVGLSPLRY